MACSRSSYTFCRVPCPLFDLPSQTLADRRTCEYDLEKTLPTRWLHQESGKEGRSDNQNGRLSGQKRSGSGEQLFARQAAAPDLMQAEQKHGGRSSAARAADLYSARYGFDPRRPPCSCSPRTQSYQMSRIMSLLFPLFLRCMRGDLPVPRSKSRHHRVLRLRQSPLFRSAVRRRVARPDVLRRREVLANPYTPLASMLRAAHPITPILPQTGCPSHPVFPSLSAFLNVVPK